MYFMHGARQLTSVKDHDDHFSGLLLLILKNLFIQLHVSPSFSLPYKTGRRRYPSTSSQLNLNEGELHDFWPVSAFIPSIFQCLTTYKLSQSGLYMGLTECCRQQNIFLLLKSQRKGGKKRTEQKD